MRLRSLDERIKVGSLHLHLPDGRSCSAGAGAPAAHMILHDRRALRRMLWHPGVAVGEGYVAREWEPGEGGLSRVLEVLIRNLRLQPAPGLLQRLRWMLSRLGEFSDPRRSRRNVQSHYDLDSALFSQFLDAGMHYSCAYFEREDMTLEEAQEAKCRHIARKLLLKPGDRVLDIGSGWGGLAIHLARNHAVSVTGLTLSRDQLEGATTRARSAGVEGRVRFVMQDYREHEGAYDAIVSVGMFEHVGRPQYRQYFDTLTRLLRPGGRVLLHTIGRSGPPAHGDHWVRKHVFPGTYIPALSEVMTPLEPIGLVLSDLEIWRLHYAETLRHWNERFQAARPGIAARRGDAFCRLWEFYLQLCEAMFRWGELVVFQLQLARDNATVPPTRDYLYPPDEAGRGGKSVTPFRRPAAQGSAR